MHARPTQLDEGSSRVQRALNQQISILFLIAVQSRNTKCLVCSGLLSIVDSTVKVEDTVSAPEGVEVESMAHRYQDQQRMGVGRVSPKCHRADYKPEGKDWITVDSAARWL